MIAIAAMSCLNIEKISNDCIGLILVLGSCKEYQFQCDNGECIKLEKKCDGWPNCRDKSDETASACDGKLYLTSLKLIMLIGTTENKIIKYILVHIIIIFRIYEGVYKN